MVNPLIRASKDAGGRVAKHAASRLAVAAAPVAGLAGDFALSCTLWGLATPESLPWMTLGIGATTAGMVVLVHHLDRRRNMLGRVFALGTPILVGAHQIAAVMAGPVSQPLLGVWGWAGASVTGAWIVRRVLRRTQDATEGARRSLWDEVSTKVGGALEGSAYTPKEKSEDRLAGPLSLEGGETVDDAQRSLSKLESVLRLPPGGARITPSPDDSSQAELTLVRRDMLRESTPYTEPSALGGTPAQPYRIGVYEDGRPMMLPLHRPGWGETALLIMGMTGAGKTFGAYVIFAEEFTRRDTYTIYVDTVKGAQSLGPLAEGIRWVIRTEAEAHALMRALRDKVVPARADYLGRRGLKNWEPGCGIPRLRVHIEEGSGLFLGDKAFVQSMERIRSVGVEFTLSMQRPSYVSLDVAARAQFGAVLCFGVAEQEDAAFAMPDEVLEAGADPSRWKNERPACCYLVAPGVDRALWTTPGRTLGISDDQLRMLARWARLHGDDLDAMTTAAFGELYTTRVPVESMVGAAPSAPAAPVVPPTPVPVPVVDDEDDEAPVRDLLGDDFEEPWRPGADDPDPSVQPGIDDPLPIGGTDGDWERPAGPKATPAEAAALFEQRLLELQAQGVEEIRAGDLVDVARKAVRSPAWVYKSLNGRVDTGQLERTDTGFRFVRELVPA
ncbi:plasmid transfer protein TraB [Saccharothrix violaceirubra]|uniref:Uncharacterized protein n=1 Tax=Saccharothrix violaceirubra TaxID=413306 RepID=A0A7W7SZH8_9PSEU|nr:hypothetical protein [Saccharothrix violaceirubra]MBB4963788.1 hypothetical protein [Saccharothrix violaceirubra]